MDTSASIISFTSEEFGTIRVMCMDGDPWFVARDVCDALGLNNTTEALRNLDDDEKGNISNIEVAQNGGRSPLIVSEPGFYKLVMRSRKPEAKAFQRWVTHEVLPAIRRDGAYVASTGEEDDAVLMARALIAADRAIKRKDALIEEMRPKAEFCDAVADSEGLVLVRDLAHIISQNGEPMGQNRLFQRLRNDGYLEKRRNEPTQRSIELGVMRVVESVYEDPNGRRRVSRIPKITGKGVAHFVSRYCGEVA